MSTVLAGGALAVALASGEHASGGARPRGSTPGASGSTRRSVTTSTLASSTTTVSPVSPVGPVGSGSLSAVRGRVIVVDAGHNGGNASHAAEISRPVFIGTQSRACDTTGTQTDDGYSEHAYNLDVALRLRDILAAAGATVVMVRTTDDGWGPCIDERAYIGNRAHADVGISIHADGGPPGGRGFHVNTPANIPGYTDDIFAASARLGGALRDAFIATGMPTSSYLGTNGLLERRDFGGLNLSDVPKVLFETANMRNATDAALLEQPDFRQSEARVLATGLSAFLAAR
jgi:N-acetylmuramoyl-L-alanine amidase